MQLRNSIGGFQIMTQAFTIILSTGIGKSLGSIKLIPVVQGRSNGVVKKVTKSI
jgi:hypothetical protein